MPEHLGMNCKVWLGVSEPAGLELLFSSFASTLSLPIRHFGSHFAFRFDNLLPRALVDKLKVLVDNMLGTELNDVHSGSECLAYP